MGTLGLAFLVCAWFLSHYLTRSAAQDRLYDDTEAIPHRRVALVLGSSRYLSDGRQNLFFTYRIAAAAELFEAGKVDYLLVSGDNHRHGYNEPQDMRDALLESGIPANRIACDYAGFSTLDSIVRAKEVFQLESVTVVSQPFHNRRALFIAQQRGLDAIAYNARGVDAYNSFKTKAREQLALIKTLADVTVLGREPHFYGEPVTVTQTQ